MVWLGSFHWLLCNMFHWLHMVCCNVALHSTNSRRLLRQSSKLPQHEVVLGVLGLGSTSGSSATCSTGC